MQNIEIQSREIAVMNITEIISATIARFDGVGNANYQAMVEPFVGLKPQDLENAEVFKAVDDVRKRIKADRTNIERLRKYLKEDSLKTGRAIDDRAKELTAPILEPEQMLETLIDGFKAYKAEQEKAKAEALARIVNDRISTLAKYGVVMSYDDALAINQDDYQERLDAAMMEHSLKEAMRIEDERRAKEAAEMLDIQKKEQEEKAKALEAKEKELAAKTLKVELKMLQLESKPGFAVIVENGTPQNIAAEVLGIYGIDWIYQSDQPAPEENAAAQEPAQAPEPTPQYDPTNVVGPYQEQGGTALESTMIDLREKMHIGLFIDQIKSIKAPSVTSPYHVQWLKALYDALVFDFN